MIALLLKMLPKEYRAILELGQRIISKFDTMEKALAFAQLVADKMKDGYISPNEWVKIGGASGITTKPKRIRKKQS